MGVGGCGRCGFRGSASTSWLGRAYYLVGEGNWNGLWGRMGVEDGMVFMLRLYICFAIMKDGAYFASCGH